jgi:multidrug transporter EmrE-like cation transporter
MSPATPYLILAAAIVAEIVATIVLARSDGFIWLGPRWPWAWYGLRLDAAAVVGMAFIVVGVVLVSGLARAVPHR